MSVEEPALVPSDRDPCGEVSFFGRRGGKTAVLLAWLREDPERFMLCEDNKATRALASRENLVVEGPVTCNGRVLPTVLLRAR